MSTDTHMHTPFLVDTLRTSGLLMLVLLGFRFYPPYHVVGGLCVDDTFMVLVALTNYQWRALQVS
jgi:hypothetical protein